MSTCKFCGEAIEWRRTESGAWQPMNLDGTLHFPTCREQVSAGRERVRQWYEELGCPSHSNEPDTYTTDSGNGNLQS